MTTLQSHSSLQTPLYARQSQTSPQTFGWLANEKKREEIKDIYDRSENIPYKNLEHIQKGVCYTRTISSTGWGQVKGFFEGIFNWCGQKIQRNIIRNPDKPLTFELKTFESIEDAREFEIKGLNSAKQVKMGSFMDLVFKKDQINNGEEPVMIQVQECLRDNNHVLVVKGKVDGRDAMEIAEAMNQAIEAVGPRGNVMESDLV